MKFAMTTDTHYGFTNRTHKIHEKFLRRLSAACEKEKVDAFIHCGDWVITDQHQLKRTWKMFRDALGDMPIFTVLGNHDHWNKEIFSVALRKRIYAKYPLLDNYMAIENQWREWAGEYDIFLMEDSHWSNDEVAIFGFNGWYDEIPVNTNDSNFMPKRHHEVPIDTYLRHKAFKHFDQCLQDSAEIKIKKQGVKTLLITHHASYTFQQHYRFMCANQGWMDYIAEEFDIYCVGHSHQPEDFIHTACNGNIEHSVRCINAGTLHRYEGDHGYDSPRFVTFEI